MEDHSRTIVVRGVLTREGNRPMKRLVIRLSALGVVIVLGLIAIAHAQLGDLEPAVADTTVVNAASDPSAADPLDATSFKSAFPAGSGQLVGSGGLSSPAASGQSDTPRPFRPDPGAQHIIASDVPAAEPGDRFSNARSATASDNWQDGPGRSTTATGHEDAFAVRGATDRGVAPVAIDNPLQLAGARQPAPLEQDDEGPLADPKAPTPRTPDTEPAGTSRQFADSRFGPIGSAADDATGRLAPQDTLPDADQMGPSSEPSRPIGSQFGQASSPYGAAGQGIAATSAASATPGGKHLEGSRSPALTIEKSAPEEVQVGKAATFETVVQNAGSVPADGVEIHDMVPAGTRLLSTSPQASQAADGRLVWSLGTLKPGELAKVQMQVMPQEEGELGSVASVFFRADATVRTTATRPQLELSVSAPRKAMVGENVTVKIKIANTGSGAASGVVLEQNVPAALEHPAGSQLEYEVGKLAPGQARELELVLTARQAGEVLNKVIARAEGNLQVEQVAAFQIVAPALQVAIQGPERRYLERRATYELSISNPGTASAKDVELVTRLPKGLKFVKANNAGTYDEASHSVYWSLAELPPQETGSVELVALPVELGQQKIRIEGKAKPGLTASGEQLTQVEGVAALSFQLLDANDPIEVGEETTYEVRVVNQGSKAATNVVLAAVLPEGLRPAAAEGPARHSVQGQRVIFEALPRLAPKADTTFRIRAQGARPGDQRIRVQLSADELQTPVVKEESTRVYGDE